MPALEGRRGGSGGGGGLGLGGGGGGDGDGGGGFGLGCGGDGGGKGGLRLGGVVATATTDRVCGGDGDGVGGGGECGERLGLGEWRRRVVVSKPNHVKRRLNKKK